MQGKHVWRQMGPGLLFSGAAVGVSHLVQSTKAGAFYGLALVGVIIAINLIKYPSYRFGVDYGKASGQSLLHGYRELTRWGPILFCLAIVPTAPIVLAAIAATTAGILTVITGLALSIPKLASILLLLAAAFVAIGGFTWLDRLNRLLFAFLLVSTLAATAMVLPRVDWSTLTDIGWMADPAALLFLVALAGFMPNPLDASIIQSIWTVEGEEKVAPADRSSLAEARLAFAAPYGLSMLLAVCFCIMGAGVIHGGDEAVATDAVGFAGQIIHLYRDTLGPGPAAITAISALSVMVTTLLAAVDIYSRMFSTAFVVIAGREEEPGGEFRRITIMALLVGMAAIMLFFLMSDFGSFIDLVTSVAFLSAPLIAILNHLVVTRCDMPDDARPSPALRGFNLFAIAVMTLLALSYVAGS